MKNNKNIWVIAGLIALVVCLSVAAVLFIFRDRGQDPAETQPTGDPVVHTVTVTNDKGAALEDVAVYVYTDSERAELAWFNKTDAEGKMCFTDVPRDTYVAVLENIPTGYAVEEYYPLTGVDTQIVLSTGRLTEEDMQTLTYRLGDLMLDFDVTAADGRVHTLSKLLEEKKAVMLNFWFINCPPCLEEFPYLQEAYAEFSDQIEVLAMNPVDTQDMVAAFQAENGYTFPMASVSESWIKMMQISAFPTSVFIDRYGNVMLIHTGSIDSAQTFKDVFNYFCADEYEQDIIKDISQIESTQEVGTKEKPAEIGGVTSFEVEIGPGKEYYVDLYKVTDMYLTIKNKDAYVIYDEKTYEPQNGTISILLKCPDVNTPAKIVIGNRSEEKQTITVQLTPKLGSLNNPYSLVMGEFTAKVSAGNEVGIYYQYTAEEDGLLKMQCLSATPGIKYSYYLYNLNTYAMRNLEEDGQTSEEGEKFVGIEVKKGHQIQFSIATLPDETHSYPAGTFQMLASFDNGVVVEDARPFNEKIDYTVTVKDEDGNGIAGVSIHLSGTVIAQEAVEKKEETEAQDLTENPEGTGTPEDTESEENDSSLEAVTETVDQYILTDENGVAILNHYPGTLEGKVRIPNGYALETNHFTLTREVPAAEVILSKIEYKDYTVKVQTPSGEPVQDAIIVVNGKVAYSNEQGSAVFNLPADTYPVLVLGISGEYVLPEGTYEVSADATDLTVTLNYAPGHESNPIQVPKQATISVKGLAGNTCRYYSVSGVNGTALELEMTGGYLLVNGTKYEPDAEGKIAMTVPADADPVTLAVFNTEPISKNVKIQFAFPAGSEYNPDQIKNRGSACTLSETVSDYWLYYSPAKNVTDGTFAVSVTKISEDIDFDIIVTNGDQTAKLSESSSDTKVTLEFVGNKKIMIQVVAKESLSEDVSITVKPTVTPRTGPTYTVTLVDENNNPLPGVQLQFVKGGEAVGGIYTTDSNGVVETALPSGTYTVVLADGSYEYDQSKATVSSGNTSVTISATRTETSVEEGMTRYNVMVTDYRGNVVGDYLLLFMKDGEPVAYNIVDSLGATTTMVLETGTYDIQLASLGEKQYYYQQSAAVITAENPNVTVKVAFQSTAIPEEHWLLSQITPLPVGGVYVLLQEDVNSYFSFTPVEQGVYRISVSDPNAVLSYWGSPTFPQESNETLKDFENTTFTISVNTNALGQSHVIGIKGTSGCIVSVVREGDAVEDVPYTAYVPTTVPVKQTLASGLKFTFLDIKQPTDTYNLVYNPTDGYYHLGSADGPVMYVQLTYNAKDEGAPYITLYEMVGGVSNTGTAFRCTYINSEGKEVREDYTDTMLSYGACADATYGVYPVTEDLAYMIKMGGQHLGWWDAENANSKMIFVNGENLEIGWMFAFCYVS